MSEHTQWLLTSVIGPISLAVMTISIWYCAQWAWHEMRDNVDEKDAENLRKRADQAEARVREKQARKAAGTTQTRKPAPKAAAPVKRSADEVAARFVESRKPAAPKTGPVPRNPVPKPKVAAADVRQAPQRRAAAKWDPWSEEL